MTDNIGGLGLFGVELFVKQDQVWFSEVSPRPHDTGMVTMVSQRQTEFDLHARAILGLPVSTELQQASASAVVLSEIESSQFNYSGLDQALQDSDVDVRLFAKPEALIGRRMGVALATATNVSEAREKALKAATLVVVKE